MSSIFTVSPNLKTGVINPVFPVEIWYCVSFVPPTLNRAANTFSLYPSVVCHLLSSTRPLPFPDSVCGGSDNQDASSAIITQASHACEIIELFQKCHNDHPYGNFFGQCTDLKIRLDSCFRQEKTVKRKANFEESKRFKERLHAFRKEQAGEENIQG